jgi:hypothetical protein
MVKKVTTQHVDDQRKKVQRTHDTEQHRKKGAEETVLQNKPQSSEKE